MRTFGIVALCCVLGGLEPAARSSQPLPTFKSSVDVVPISAVVRDGRGRLVTTLKAADFEVLDKGERRRIVDFQVDRTSSVTLAVLVDMSGSMRVGQKLTMAQKVLNQLKSELRDGHDEVGLFTFDAALNEHQAFTTNVPSLDTELTGAEPFGTTSLYDAIAETARRLDDRSSSHRAIVVLTDGFDTSSTLTPTEVSGLASSIDVPVYVVVTVPPIDHELQLGNPSNRAARSSADLRELALWTGGELLWAGAGEDAVLHGHRILSELRHRYLIAIESAPEREWRPIDVRVRDRRLMVRARNGYFSGDRP